MNRVQTQASLSLSDLAVNSIPLVFVIDELLHLNGPRRVPLRAYLMSVLVALAGFLRSRCPGLPAASNAIVTTTSMPRIHCCRCDIVKFGKTDRFVFSSFDGDTITEGIQAFT